MQRHGFDSFRLRTALVRFCGSFVVVFGGVRATASIKPAPGPDSDPHRAALFQPSLPVGWNEGNKRVLTVRVDFSDEPHSVLSESAITAAVTTVGDLYGSMSGGKLTFTSTVVPVVLRMPRPKSHYQSAPTPLTDLGNDGLAVAQAYDRANGNTGQYDPARADRWVLMCYQLPTGVSSASPAGLVFFNVPGAYDAEPLAGVLGHELGHTLGFPHSHAWRTTTAPLGEGLHEEYGNPFEIMGNASLGHVNVVHKLAAGFLPRSAVLTVAESGTVRLYRHDDINADGVRAIRLRTADSEFWLEHRQRAVPRLSASSVERMRAGVLIHLGKNPGTNGRIGEGTYLLDMTPGTPSSEDATLIAGQTFSEPNGAFTVSVVGTGGAAPREYVEVRIDLPPIIATQPVSADLSVGGSATLHVAANGAATYQWRKYGVDLPGASGPSLALSNVRRNDSGAYSVVVTTATGTAVSRDAIVRVGGYEGPVFRSQPASGASTVSTGIDLLAPALADVPPSYRWYKDGVPVADADRWFRATPFLTVRPLPDQVGLYHVLATNSGGSILSQVAIAAPLITSKLTGSAVEVGSDIHHQNGNIYDQVLLTGAGASMRADPGQVLRCSFIDLHDDIIQVEFSGAGTLTLTLEDSSGPSPPAKYNQPEVSYMKGHANILIAGANETTHLNIFTVGRVTAVNQSLFRDSVSYDGIADIGHVGIVSPSGRFGGLRAGNVHFWNTRGHTGVYARGVAFGGPVVIGEVTARNEAMPWLLLGGIDTVTIAGGSLDQDNGANVRVDGIGRLEFTAGTDSAGNLRAAGSNRATLEQDEVDVTAHLTR